MRQFTKTALAHATLRTSERLDETLVRIWLEHVIGSSQIERINRISTECRDEHHHWAAALKMLRQLHAIQSRHLNIEEHDVGAAVFDHLPSPYTVTTLDDRGHFRIAAQDGHRYLARERLIVHDHHLELRHR
jgi:hypothetical protein